MAVIEAAGKLVDGSIDIFSSLTPTGSLLDKATLDNEEPTPGYMFHELTKFSFKSLKSCASLEDNLLRKLKKPSPFVKLKCLRIIKHLFSKGHPSFRTDMRRRHESPESSPLRECVVFRSALGNDSPIDRIIREEAQEIINLLYVDGDSAADPGGEAGGLVPDQAYPAAHMSHGPAPVYSASSGGIGNYVAQPKKGMHGFFVSVAEKLEDAFTPSSSSYQNFGTGSRYSETYTSPGFHSGSGVPSGIGSMGGFNPAAEEQKWAPPTSFGSTSTTPAAPPPRTFVAPAATTTSSPPSFAGSPSTTAAAVPAGVFTSTYVPQQQQQQQQHSAPVSAGAATTDSSYEKSLVDQITIGSAARAAPSREALATFCSRLPTLNIDSLLDVLEDKLEGSSWQEALRALYILEAMLDSTVQFDKQFVEDVFASSEALKELAASNKTAVRAKAKRILERLGLSDDLPSEAAQSTPQLGLFSTLPATVQTQPVELPLASTAPDQQVVVQPEGPATVVAPTPIAAPVQTVEPHSTPGVVQSAPARSPLFQGLQVSTPPPASPPPPSVVQTESTATPQPAVQPPAVPQPAPVQQPLPVVPAAVPPAQPPATPSPLLQQVLTPTPTNTSPPPATTQPVAAPTMSLIDIDIPAFESPKPAPAPAPENNSPLASLLSLNFEPIAEPAPAPKDTSLLRLHAEDPQLQKRALENDLISSNISELHQEQLAAQEQHKKQQLENDHFQRLRLAATSAGGLVSAPAGGAVAGASPFMSSAAITVLVPTGDGTAVPMMLTGLPLVGASAVAPATFASTSALPSSPQMISMTSMPLLTSPPPEPRPEGYSFVRGSKETIVPPSRFDFISSAISEAKLSK